MSDSGEHWEGELPADAVMVKQYEVGYGRLAFISEDGGTSAPIVTVRAENAPLQFFVAPDALSLSHHLEEAAVASLRMFDPELMKLPTPAELRAKRDALILDHHRRQRIILLGWVLTVILVATIALVFHGSVWRGVEGAFWVPGLIWVTEVSAAWFAERRVAREERDEHPKP